MYIPVTNIMELYNQGDVTWSVQYAELTVWWATTLCSSITIFSFLATTVGTMNTLKCGFDLKL